MAVSNRVDVVPEGMEAVTRFYTPAVVDDQGTVWCAGVIGTDESGGVSTEPAEQFERAFANCAGLLDAAGCGWDDVVEMTTFHVGLSDHMRAFVKARNGAMSQPFPAWTAIGTTELAVPGGLVEIKLTARRPSS